MPVRDDGIREKSDRWPNCEHLQDLFWAIALDQFGFLLYHLQTPNVPVRCLRLGSLHSLDFSMISSFQHLSQLDLFLHSKISRGGLTAICRLQLCPKTTNTGPGSDYPARDGKLMLVASNRPVDTFRMPNLTSIRFTTIQVSDKKLVDFFLRYGKTLECVGLERTDSTATGGILTHFQEQMQHLLRLEHVHIRGESRTESGKSMILGPGSKEERLM